MEMRSTINNLWKLCLIISLFGCLILLLVYQVDHYTCFLATQNTIELSPFIKSKEPMSPQILPVDFTIQSEQKEEKSTQIYHIANPNISVPLNKFVKKIINTTIEKKCNMFQGKWVYKPEENPIYDAYKCPFIEEKMNCQKNGRPDFEYEKWRWEATNCDIPLFNGRDMLEKLRNKRVIIVGDSLNRNMWESLACLLYSSVRSSRAEVQTESSEYKVLKIKDYNIKIEFHWSPFLIEYNMKNHKSGRRVIVIDKISPNSKQWRGADFMVFNSGYWWTHKQKMLKWDLFEYKGKLLEEMPIEMAYEMGMKTWTKWVERNVDPKKTVVVFRSISAKHNVKQWCYNSTKPLIDESFSNTFPKYLMIIIERLLHQMTKSKVRYLNITRLSEYRIDAHPSVYKSSNWRIYTTKYKKLIRSSTDCSHWCLPGLPDTWNRLLYASLFFDA